MDILGDEGRAALAAAAAEADPASLAAAERMRRQFAPDLAAAALTQVTLRRRATAKCPRAPEMFFTPDGLEQASRREVARWRAARFRDAGVEQVWDLGCGIGADAMAFQEAGITPHGVEVDVLTAALATANLALVGAPPVRLATAEETRVPAGAGVFLDPARRSGRGRTWRVEDFTPPWQLVEHYLASGHFTCVKLGPGLPKELIPDGVGATWVSVGGDVVEVSLWNRLEPGYAAVLLTGQARALELRGDGAPRGLPVASPGRYLLEPDNAVVRAGLVTEVAPGEDIWLLDEHVAYLSSDTPVQTPFAQTFEILEVLDHDVRTLRRWVKQNRIGTLEIKKRAVDVDPASLRRQLRPAGPNRATIILARTPAGTRALVSRRA